MDELAQPLDWRTEEERIVDWRYEELKRAGYDHDSAVVLAASEDVDLHRAIDVRRRGCSQDLALQILL